MADFMVRFGICNLFLCGIIGILFLARHLFRNILSARMQYHLWFLLLGLLIVPFLPFRLFKFPQIILWFQTLSISPVSKAEHTIGKAATLNQTTGNAWMEDLTLSVDNKISSSIGWLLLILWICGIVVALAAMIKSALCLRALKKSSLPLQNRKIEDLYQCCLKESGITKNIPIYSTVFLKSPIITGLFRPRIYLPIPLISDGNETDIRYMLLHELQHYKHKDGIVNYLMNIAKIIYWFHPLVRYALNEMKNDCEIACDTSVLNQLNHTDYIAYGDTLLHFAEKISLTPFPFASGISGSMKQMKRRITNIATYEKPTLRKWFKGMLSFLLTSILLFGLTPFVSTYAADETHYQQNVSSKNNSKIDLSDYFGEYEGSFVLYDLKHDTWKIHDKERASLRVAPNSTYKLYSALFGLENNIITPANSLIRWNGESYPFEAWNKDQTLQSAMTSSVNWYFQSIDEQLGSSAVQNYLRNIGYGNEDLSGDFSSYWMESSLKISPVEQVELLTKLYSNDFGFAPENIKAVKDSIHIASSATGNFYAKTGTGRVNGQDVNGWFIGFIERTDNTYFFATNIHAKDHADGSTAAEITMSVLSDMKIWI